MEREGIFIDTRTDRILEPKIYFSSEMWEERREEASLFIQRVARGKLARNKTNHLKLEKEKLRRELIEKKEEIRKEEEIKHKQEIERRVHPRNKQDFNILFDELEVLNNY